MASVGWAAEFDRQVVDPVELGEQHVNLVAQIDMEAADPAEFDEQPVNLLAQIERRDARGKEEEELKEEPASPKCLSNIVLK